jgi:transposase
MSQKVEEMSTSPYQSDAELLESFQSAIKDKTGIRAKRKRGRPTKFNPEIADNILVLVTSGNFMETAAAFTGISKQTLYTWLKRGAREHDGPYRKFLDALTKASGESAIRGLKPIVDAANAGNWQAAAWRLERQFPKLWCRKDQLRTEISGPDGGPIKTESKPSEPIDGKQFDSMARSLFGLSGPNSNPESVHQADADA